MAGSDINAYTHVQGAAAALIGPSRLLLQTVKVFATAAGSFTLTYGNGGANRSQRGSGSGVIISEDGYIVTNNHVVEKADIIRVILNDNREYTAKVIGTDPATDMAVIKIDETNLPPIAIGNSDEINVGEWVLAVGNPFNLTSTVTAGIVSAKGRNINLLRQNSEYAIENFIQTDAAEVVVGTSVLRPTPAPTPPPGPRILYVLPLPVCPYAKTVALSTCMYCRMLLWIYE